MTVKETYAITQEWIAGQAYALACELHQPLKSKEGYYSRVCDNPSEILNILPADVARKIKQSTAGSAFISQLQQAPRLTVEWAQSQETLKEYCFGAHPVPIKAMRADAFNNGFYAK